MGTPADPIGWLAIGSSLVSGFSSIASGLNESAQMRSQAAAAEYNAQISDIRATQISADRKDELNAALGSINAIRSTRGVSLDSATGRAIRNDRRRRARDAENTEVLGERLNGMSLRNEASGLRRASKWAKISGFAKSLPSFAQAGSDFQSLGQ